MEKQVKIAGQVSSKQTYKNNFTSFKIKDSSGEINVICSCQNIQINQSIETIGKVQEYKNNLQIQADKIILSDNF